MLLLTPAGSGAVTVNVNASVVLQTIQDELYGQNMSVYDSTINASSTNYVNAVAAMGTTQMRIPGGGYGSMVDWQDIEAGPYGNCGAGGAWMTSMSEILGFAAAVGPSLRLQPIINYKGTWCPTSGDPYAKAAAWVRYLNITGGGARPAEFWEIGNETFFTGDPSYEANGTTYGNNYVTFYNAMKAEDPTIKIGLQCQFDDPTWSRNALTAVRNAGLTPDFLIAHAYPMWKANNPADYNTTAADAEVLGQNVDIMATFHGQMDTIVSNSGFTPGSIPYWMTEYRSSVPEAKANQWVDALWSAQFVLEMGRLGWQGANIWSIKNGYSTVSQSDYGLLRNGSGNSDDSPADTPRPTWYVFPFLSKVFGRDLVGSSDNATLVRTWSSLDAAGDLTIFMVNNDPNAANTATVNLSGFTPDTAVNAGRIWTLVAAGTTTSGGTTPTLRRRHISVNGMVNPAVGAVPGGGNSLTIPGTSFTVNLPAASMVLVKVPRNNGPTATPTPYAGTPTFTVTPTPEPCELLLHGAETINENGTWVAGDNGGNPTSVLSIVGSPAAAVTQGAGALQLALTADAGAWTYAAGLQGFAPAAMDGFSQILMDVYVDASVVAGSGWNAMELLANCATCSAGAGEWFQPLAGAQDYVAGVNTLVFDVNMSGTIGATDPVSEILIILNRQLANTGNIYIDNVRLVSATCYQPTATPSPTVTPTPYVGPLCDVPVNGFEALDENGTWSGASAVRSLVSAPAGAVTQGSWAMQASITTTAGFNADWAQLVGFTPVNLAEFDMLMVDLYADPAMIGAQAWNQVLVFADCGGCAPPKYFKQITAGRTLAAGANALEFIIDPALEAVDPLLPTDTITALNFVFNSEGTTPGTLILDNLIFRRQGDCFTATPTFSSTATPTASPSPSLTPTPTRTPSGTPSMSPSATGTATRTATVGSSATSTGTATPTTTWTVTGTLSATPSPTPSATQTWTPTGTGTGSPTGTHTGTHTATASPTPSLTATGTATPTHTPPPPGSSPTITPTISLTFTRSPTDTHTGTATPTGTPTGTLTDSPTATASFTQTVTGSSTGTPSHTGTGTATPSASPSAAASASPTVSATPSATQTGTPTGSPTQSPTETSALTGTGTATPGATFTATPTPTPSATFSVTASATPMPGATASSTATPTPSASPSAPATLTQTPTPSGTATPSASPSTPATLTQTPAPSGTATPSPSGTPTPTPSFTPSLAPQIFSLDLSEGPVEGGTVVTVTGSNFFAGLEAWVGGQRLDSESVNLVSSTVLELTMPPHDAGWVDLQLVNPGLGSAVAPAAFTYRWPEGISGQLVVEKALLSPNPLRDQAVQLHVYLQAPATALRWTLYSPGMTRVADGEVEQALRPGWNHRALNLPNLTNGLFYLVVRAVDGSRAVSDPVVVKVFVLK